MIELTPATAVLLYLGITLGTLLGFWAYFHYKTRKHKLILTEKQLFQCEFCHFSYVDEMGSKLTQCPQCGSFNKDEGMRDEK